MSKYQWNGQDIAAPVEFRSNEPVIINDTLNLHRHQQTNGAQRWEIAFRVFPGADYNDVFVNRVTSRIVNRSMIMPQLQNVNDEYTVSDETLTISAASAGASSVTVTQTNQNELVLPKGYFFKFSNHNKIYMTTDDTEFTATGGTVSFFPDLLEDVTASHTLNTGDQATLTYVEDVDNYTGITFTDGVLTDFGRIALVEVI